MQNDNRNSGLLFCLRKSKFDFIRCFGKLNPPVSHPNQDTVLPTLHGMLFTMKVLSGDCPKYLHASFKHE